MKFSKFFSKLISTQSDALFEEIIGYNHIKRPFRMAITSDSAVHILLVDPPALAKTMFLTSLMRQLKNSYFTGIMAKTVKDVEFIVDNFVRLKSEWQLDQ